MALSNLGGGVVRFSAAGDKLGGRVRAKQIVLHTAGTAGQFVVRVGKLGTALYSVTTTVINNDTIINLYDAELKDVELDAVPAGGYMNLVLA